MEDWFKKIERWKKENWRLRWWSRWYWFLLKVECWWLDWPKKWLYCSWAHRGHKHQHVHPYRKHDKWHCGKCLTYVNCKGCNTFVGE